MRCVALVLLAACGDSGTRALPPVDAPDQVPPTNPLDGIGAVERVDGGYMFVEGPAWNGTDVLFSDIPADTIFRYTPGGPAPSVAKMPSHNSNGLAFDAQGRLYAAEHGSRSVTRDGVALASTFEGKRLNSPNDLVLAADGALYFTDPPFGIQDADRELDFIGVFRLAGDGTLAAEHRGALAERPNGVGISPDGTRLYVDDSADGNLYRYPIDAGGALGPRELHAQTAGTPDGLALDAAGNVFVTTTAGVEVFAPDGTRWGVIAVPEQPANCAFGDPDLRRLYITARTGLYRVQLANP